MALRLTAFFKIVLVIIFSGVKLCDWDNRGGDRFGELAGLFEVGFGCAGELFLRSIREKDGAPVLGTNVGALPVERGGIVVVPEDVEELGVGDLFRIVSDADGFGVAGAVGADVLVGRILGGTAGIADFGDEDTFGLAEGFFDAPKATSSENGCLGGREFQSDGVEAIPAASGFRTVVEDVTEVSVATGAKDFGAGHAVAAVGDLGYVITFDWLEETRPTGAGVEFGRGTEQRQTAANTRVDAGLVVVVERPAEGRLRAISTGDLVLLGSEEMLPFGVGFNDFLHGVGGSQCQ